MEECDVWRRSPIGDWPLISDMPCIEIMGKLESVVRTQNLGYIDNIPWKV